MADDSQLIIPPSFIALYVPPGRIKPTLAHAEMYERFELCEDLSQTLVDQAGNIRHELGIAPEDVLDRIHRGLRGEASPVTEGEAGWVVGRLAEHLGWEDALVPLGLALPPDRSRGG